MWQRLTKKLGGAGRSGPWTALGTEADRLLQIDVLRLLTVADMIVEGGDETSRCPDRRPVGVETVTPLAAAPDGTFLPWAERWTIERCGTLTTYLVDFQPDGAGGTDFQVRMGDGSEIIQGSTE